MKIAAAASYNGRSIHIDRSAKRQYKFVDFSEIPALSTAHSMVTGSVAEELAVENAVNTGLRHILEKRDRILAVKNQ